MKLISLNIWGGILKRELLDFINQTKDSADIFCFQEVYSSPVNKTIGRGAQSDILGLITDILPDFQGFFAPSQNGFDFEGPVDYELSFGLAIFVKKTIVVKEHGDAFVYRFKNSRVGSVLTEGKNLEFITFDIKGRRYAVFNFHGLWGGGPKDDMPERIEQSSKVRGFMDKFTDCHKIICGDFNLLPDTKSLAIVAEGMQDLIKIYKVTTTRTPLYTKGYAKFADYILATNDIKIKNFEIMQKEVSDHLPLKVEFD